jgi:hypothetical protein
MVLNRSHWPAASWTTVIPPSFCICDWGKLVTITLVDVWLSAYVNVTVIIKVTNVRCIILSIWVLRDDINTELSCTDLGRVCHLTQFVIRSTQIDCSYTTMFVHKHTQLIDRLTSMLHSQWLAHARQYTRLYSCFVICEYITDVNSESCMRVWRTFRNMYCSTAQCSHGCHGRVIVRWCFEIDTSLLCGIHINDIDNIWAYRGHWHLLAANFLYRFGTRTVNDIKTSLNNISPIFDTKWRYFVIFFYA